MDWIEAAENYVQLHAGRVNHLLHVAMNELERLLDPEKFLRVHRSIIVNVSQIKELHTLDTKTYHSVPHDTNRANH